MYIGSRSGSGTCFVAFRACAERRNFSHLESRGNKVSKMAHQAVSCSTVCLLSSRCATRGRGDRACLPRTRASCAPSPARSGSLGPPEPGGSQKRSATSSLTDTTAGSGSPRVHFHGAGTGRTVLIGAQESPRLLDVDRLVPKEPSSRGVCRWGSQPARRVSNCGRPLQRGIAKGIAEPPSGWRTRQ